jgi:imidazolonepropionase-like amidohydrolase
LRYAIGRDQLVDGTVLDAVDGVPAQDTVGDEGIYSSSALLLEELCSSRDLPLSVLIHMYNRSQRPSHGASGVDKIVDQNTDTVDHVTYEDHAGALGRADLGRAAFLGWLGA